MFSNSLAFYNYTQLENCSLVGGNFQTYKPSFRAKFNFSSKDKKRIIQTADLLRQFFNARPKLSVHRKFGKATSFNILIFPNFNSTLRVLRLVYLLRSSSRKKLASFKFKREGSIYIILRDFVTLYPFKIKDYDFYDWRFGFVLYSHFHNQSDFTNFNSINFYFNFFNLQ